jgi:hypothetical protein
MKHLSFRDVEKLSAYLDRELSQVEAARLESRVKTDVELAAALNDLRQTRNLLRRIPQRRAPRNFTLTPRMAGIRPPLPRAVPALSWASLVAVVMFVFTLGGNLVGRVSFGASAPMMAAAPAGLGGGSADSAYEAATQAPLLTNDTALSTTTPEMYTMAVPEATQDPSARIIEPPAEPSAKTPALNPWLLIWPGAALLLASAALLLRWLRQRSFARQLRKK